jgi:hypothetical protein
MAACDLNAWRVSYGIRRERVKAACPEHFPDKVPSCPGVPPSSFFSEGCVFNVSFFVSEAADPSTMSSHSLLAA